ncbi:MAG: HAMP domain-containing protein [Gammaproteobacteria bacterium]|nr:HAMP domain-containing protein [Gammaproteobacteria bacterium]
MTLHTRLNLVLAGLSATFVAVLLVADVNTARLAIEQEISASNLVATQLLGRLAVAYSPEGNTTTLLRFLDELGRIKRNDLTLLSAAGATLYRSPPSTYKAGRSAPGWFARLLAPDLQPARIELPSGQRLLVAPDASRAILDAWDRILRLLIVAAGMLALLYALASWVVARALAPFPLIAAGLTRIRRGELDYRLPPLPGPEAQTIGAAFNGMAAAVQEKVVAERKALDAEMRLAEQHEFDRVLEQRLDAERRAIAHELHDEFSQSVTAIRSLALAIRARLGERDAGIEESARLIAEEAARLHDAMHGLIPRLAPLTLDTLGLGETLENLRRDWQRRSPSVSIALRYDVRAELGASIALAVYRVVQEGLINALRHAAPARVDIDVGSDGTRIRATVADDGSGLPAEVSRPGCFGLRGLAERVAGLGGQLALTRRAPRGASLQADIPLHAGPPE